MLNIYPVDDIYRNSFLKKMGNEDLSEEEIGIYNNYDVDVQEKAKQDAAIIKNLALEAEATKIAIKEIEDKYENLLNQIERAKANLKQLLELNQIDNIKTPLFNIRIVKNPGATYIYNEVDIPQEYVKETVVRTLDKKHILEDLKCGVIIPGAELKQNTRIDIK